MHTVGPISSSQATRAASGRINRGGDLRRHGTGTNARAMRIATATACALLASTIVTPACGSFDDPADDGDYTIVDEGKEDSFRSPAALEFLAKADATVTLAESDRSLTDA